MIDEIIVKRYADAFMDFAKATIGLDRALDDFKRLKAIMRENTGFGEILHSPQISLSEKFNFIERLLAGDYSRESIQFLGLLLEKGRIDKLADITEYIRINYSHEGETEAILKTSFPLDLEVIQQIKDKLQEKFHKKLRFYIDLDGDLLGGVQVVIGNTVLDGSVAGRLDDLREKLRLVRV